MAVKTAEKKESKTEDNVEAKVEAKAKELESISIVLKGFNRLVAFGTLFEAGVVYEVKQSDAQKYLSMSDEDGRPMFARYRAPVEVAPSGPKVVRVNAGAVESGEGVSADGAIRIGTPEEEAELYGRVDGTPDETPASDAGDQVAV